MDKLLRILHLRRETVKNTGVIAGQRVGAAVVAVGRIPEDRNYWARRFAHEHRN